MKSRAEIFYQLYVVVCCSVADIYYCLSDLRPDEVRNRCCMIHVVELYVVSDVTMQFDSFLLLSSIWLLQRNIFSG